MSDYTPTMERLRADYLRMRAERFGFTDLYAAEWDRALAAHNAEVRAGVVTEEPEWEYRAVACELDSGDVYDSTRSAPSTGEAIDIAAAERLLESNADMPALVISTQRRRKAGPWLPVGE